MLTLFGGNYHYCQFTAKILLFIVYLNGKEKRTFMQVKMASMETLIQQNSNYDHFIIT